MVKDQTVKLDYDEAGDTLYVSLGESREATCIEPQEGILLRIDPETGELVGLTIIHFRYRLKNSEDSLVLSIPLVPKDLMPKVMREWHLQAAA